MHLECWSNGGEQSNSKEGFGWFDIPPFGSFGNDEMGEFLIIRLEIWKWRNERIFNNKIRDKDDIVDELKLVT